MDYELVEGKTERLVGICRQAGATDLPVRAVGARATSTRGMFAGGGRRAASTSTTRATRSTRSCSRRSITHVSVLDLIFNEGPDATRYMLSF